MMSRLNDLCYEEVMFCRQITDNFTPITLINLMKNTPTTSQPHAGLLAKTEVMWSATACNIHYRKDAFIFQTLIFSFPEGLKKIQTLDIFHFGELKKSANPGKSRRL